MPIRASLHFHRTGTKARTDVSMPIRASLHFHTTIITLFGGKQDVSMPIRASLHFHGAKKGGYHDGQQCVNAHSGFSSFPRRYSKRATSKCGFVSIPIRASLHFHNTGAIYRLILDNHVSMPIRAFLHFYLKNGVCFHGGNGCVNALLGFPSFLQHPSGTRRNKAFSRPFLQVFI